MSPLSQISLPPSGRSLDSLFVLRRIQSVLNKREKERKAIPVPQPIRPGSINEFRPLPYFPWRTAVYSFPPAGRVFRLILAVRRLDERMGLEGRNFFLRVSRKLVVWFPSLKTRWASLQRFSRLEGAFPSLRRWGFLSGMMAMFHRTLITGREVCFCLLGAALLTAKAVSPLFPRRMRDPARWRLRAYRLLSFFRKST